MLMNIRFMITTLSSSAASEPLCRARIDQVESELILQSSGCGQRRNCPLAEREIEREVGVSLLKNREHNWRHCCSSDDPELFSLKRPHGGGRFLFFALWSIYSKEKDEEVEVNTLLRMKKRCFASPPRLSQLLPPLFP